MKPGTIALLYFAAIVISVFVFNIHEAPKREQEIFSQWLMLGVLVILSYTGAIHWRRYLDDIRQRYPDIKNPLRRARLCRIARNTRTGARPAAIGRPAQPHRLRLVGI